MFFLFSKKQRKILDFLFSQKQKNNNFICSIFLALYIPPLFIELKFPTTAVVQAMID